MRTIEIKVYTFDELSDAAKEKAREWFRQFVFQYPSDWDAVFNYAEEVGRILGIEIDQRRWTNQHGHSGSEPKIYFSGFWKQGDGASFEGRYRYAKGASQAIRSYAPQDSKLHRIADTLQRIQKPYFYRLTASISQSGRYSHSHTMSVNVCHPEDNERSIADAEEVITDCMRDFADWIYCQLENEYEYQSSNQAVDESIRSNEYEFTEEGKRV